MHDKGAHLIVHNDSSFPNVTLERFDVVRVILQHSSHRYSKRDIRMRVRLKKYFCLVAGSVICCEHANVSAEGMWATGSEIAIEENEHAHVGTRRNAGDI